MKILLILALSSVAFSALTWTVTYNDACTTQTAVLVSSDSTDATYWNWMADCPSTITGAGATDDSAYDCNYYAQSYDVVSSGTTSFDAYTVDLSTTATGDETFNSLSASFADDTDCGTAGSAAYVSGASTITCTWTVVATETYWATSFVTVDTGALSAASFTESVCGDSSSAFTIAGVSSAILLF